MNTYLINLEEENCKSMNNNFALQMGCEPPTIYWFDMWKHPVIDLWLLSIDPDHEYLLTDQQRSALVPYSVIEAEGWIQPNPFPPR